MRRWLAVRMSVIAIVATVGGAHAAEGELRASTAAARKELVATIEGQLAAFRKGDVAEAYSFSATLLRRQRPLRTFTAIVQESYPEIWENADAEFGLARDDGERATIVVLVQGPAGKASYDFFLVKERAGWRIGGVLKRVADKGARV